MVVTIKAMACELPAKAEQPLARWQCPDLARAAVEQGIVASISGTTIWRWLSADAIKPWQHRSWIFPRDPDFGPKAARVLDLYARRFDDTPLRSDEFVISADEKTSIQARVRKHDTTAAASGQPMRVEHEYARGGALAYLAAWDVHRAKVFGRCEAATGIDPFDRLVEQVMTNEPYASARRVFWVVDNGSSHRGQPSIDRLEHPLADPAAWQAPYELYSHCAVGRHVGLSDDEVRILAEGGFPKDLSDTETVAHRIARALSVEHHLDDALYREAEKLLGANGIMDAVILTGIYHTVCAILNAFVIPAPS